MSWTVGLTLAGRYRVDAALGASSPPRVWAATHLPTGRRVAMRRLPPPGELPQRAAMQLLGEVRAAASVQHPNVTELYEVVEGVDDGPLLVSELLRGETLEQKLSQHPMLSIRETASVMLPVVSAVGTAHARGIVHGGLAPSNVYLWTGNGALPPVKVLNFGVARWTAGVNAPISVRPGAHAVKLSSDYTPPEHSLPERSIDHRADTWALGCLLYECLTGLRPREFAPRDAEASALVMPIEQRAPGVPRALADIIAHLLVSDPDHRAQNLIELFNVLSPLAVRPSPSFGWPGSERRVSGLTQRASMYPEGAGSSPTPASSSVPGPPISSTIAPRPPLGLSWRTLALGASAVAAAELVALAWLLARSPHEQARAATAPSADAQEQRLSLQGRKAPPRQVLFDDFEDGNGSPLAPGFDNWQAFTVNPAGQSLELKLGPGHQSRGSVEMSWLLDHVLESKLGPAGAGLRSIVRSGVINLSHYQHVSLAHRYAPMVTPGLECRGASSFVVFVTCRSLRQDRPPNFELSIPVSMDWSTTSLDLYDLRETGGPLARATNLKACLAATDSFGFRVDATDATTGSCDSGTLWLDDIGFR